MISVPLQTQPENKDTHLNYFLRIKVNVGLGGGGRGKSAVAPVVTDNDLFLMPVDISACKITPLIRRRIN